MVEVKISSWNSIWPECEELMFEHWKEVRENKEHLPFEVDTKGVAQLSDLSLMRVIEARESGKLVGYLIWFLTPALESAGNKVATMGPFYVVPESKGAGWKMWQLGLDLLRRVGVKVAYAHHSAFGPRQEAAQILFKRSGGKLFELKYELVL